MLKVLINEEEVLTNKNFTIKKEMLNTPSVILNNVYPKTWEDSKDYTSNFYHPQDYSKCKIIDENIIPAEPGETITGTSFTIQDNDNTKLNELTELDGNTSQSGTPTPSSPVPINVVSGMQNITTCGYNFINVNNITPPQYSKDNSIYLYSGEYYCYVLVSDYTNFNSFLRYSTTKNGTYTTFETTANEYGKVDQKMQYYVKKCKITITKPCWVGIDLYDNRQQTISAVITKDSTYYSSVRNDYKAGDSFEGSTYYNVLFKEYEGNTYKINLGENLFPTPYDASSTTKNGITFTILEDGSINVSGTATAKTSFALRNRDIRLDLQIGETYTVAATGLGAIDSTIWLDTYGTSGSFLGRWSLTSTSNHTTAVAQEKDLKPYITISVENGVTIDTNVKVWLYKGAYDENITYTTYKTPIELCKINTYKDAIFRGSGVNLFDKDTILTNKIINASGEIIDTNNYIVGDFIEVKPNTQYTISFTSTNTELLRIGYYKNDKTYIERPTSADNPWTITTPSNCYYIRVCTPSVYQNVMVNEGTTALPYEPYNSKGKWLLHKEIGKFIYNNEGSISSGATNYYNINGLGNRGWLLSLNTKFYLSNKYEAVKELSTDANFRTETANMDYAFGIHTNGTTIRFKDTRGLSLNDFKSSLIGTQFYYVLATPTTIEITDSELISQLNAIELLEGLNNVSVSSGDLAGEITIHYNYTEEQTIDDLLFCGVVKNSGNISLNPREPHFQSLQILDFKTFLSEGELDSFVIYQKTILEAIQMVIANIQDYGFILGNVNILNPTDIIGAYSTKDKTAYDVFNYIADITQSRWTTRLIDENHVAIDFYDPTLMIEGTPINYTQAFFENNLIDDMTYSYGSSNYRNKQVMTSSQVYSNISQQQSIVANGYQTQFPTEQPIGKINSITSNGIPLTFATFTEKEMGYVADFYYQPGDNYFESEDLRTTGEILIIDYVAIVEGRQIITNPLEIDRISDSTGRKGIISRYEQRNDATTSTELQKIGESYIKYKGTPEIKLKISTRKNIWEVGQRVQFNAPIEELDTEYMIRTKKINYISTIDTIFYEYELISSFNSETEINYFDNQRAKASGNIGEGEYISRNIDIESTANIIFYDTETTEVQVDGDNVLNSILNSPFTS